jgi:hypothetical protein
MVLKPTRRIAAALSSALLGIALLSGCSSDNVNCGVDECTVTIDREVNASASVLGVEAKLVSADADTVTLDVAGKQVTLTKGQQSTQVAGLQLTLDSITGDTVSFQVSRT